MAHTRDIAELDPLLTGKFTSPLKEIQLTRVKFYRIDGTFFPKRLAIV